MTIYDFSLASMYEVTGVDTAMCNRAGIFREMGYTNKMIFTTHPTTRDLLLYTGKGLKYDQILGVHCFFTDIDNLAPTANLRKMVDYLKKSLGCTDEEQEGDYLILKKNNLKTVAFHLTADRNFFYSIAYYHSDAKWTTLVRTDFYADVLYATVFYEAENGEISERFFYNRDGSIALIQIFWNRQECNIFPDGSRYNNRELFSLFVQRLHLTKSDVVIIDRALGFFSSKALFLCFGQTNIVTIVHSEHYNIKGFTYIGERLSREYWYWCKYSQYIHTMIVGTEGQKMELEKTLKQYQFVVPEIRVIPPVCLDRIRYPKESRKRKSLVCVTRLFVRKKIEWTILAVVKAHEMDNEITLDIYGMGVQFEYVGYLQQLIEKYKATNYVSLKGYMDVSEIYQKYEVFLTTSLGESFGITLLEAVGSGLAMIGLDVRYGNQQFIENGRNGYLVEYNPEHFYEECPTEVEELADRIVEILSDEEKWKAFSKRSYEIAGQYLSEQVKQKWYDLICPKMTI